MGLFQDAFKKIGEAVTDAGSLDVVTYKGRIVADLNGTTMPDTFQKVLDLAASNTSFKVQLLASTQCKLDGDVLAYVDKDITAEEARAHNDLVALAQKHREAVIDFVHRVVASAVDV